MPIINLIGNKYGRLTVVSFHSSNKRTLWNTKCECGKLCTAEAYNLKIGNTSSCGCLQNEIRRAKSLKVLAGTKFNQLTVIKELDKLILPCGQVNRVYLCLCDCGNETKVRHLHLIRNRIKTCGCAHGEKHNMSKTKLYRVWRQMQERCHKSYAQERNIKNYQDRGIIVCDNWRKSFQVFHDWCIANGYKEGLEIDRVNNDGNYDPENCRFVTRAINNSNRRVSRWVEINGIKKPLTEWSKMSGIGYATLTLRINSGWANDKLLTPVWGRESNPINTAT